MRLTVLAILRIFIFMAWGAAQLRNSVSLTFKSFAQIAPKIIILELGSNDLVKVAPETVGSELEKLVRDLHGVCSVEFIVVGQVLRRRTPDSEEYNCKVGKLHRYLKVVPEQLPFC